MANRTATYLIQFQNWSEGRIIYVFALLQCPIAGIIFTFEELPARAPCFALPSGRGGLAYIVISMLRLRLIYSGNAQLLNQNLRYCALLATILTD